MKKIFSLVIVLMVLGCENQLKNNQFLIQLELYSKVNDSVHVYFLENNNLNFKENKSVWITIKGIKKNQKIEISLPKKELTKQVRFDFGHNELVQEVVLNKITFSRNNFNVSLKGKEIYQYFRIDTTNTKLNIKTGVLSRKYENQKAVFSLYPKGDKLFQRLNQLYSEK